MIADPTALRTAREPRIDHWPVVNTGINDGAKGKIGETSNRCFLTSDCWCGPMGLHQSRSVEELIGSTLAIADVVRMRHIEPHVSGMVLFEIGRAHV